MYVRVCVCVWYACAPLLGLCPCIVQPSTDFVAPAHALLSGVTRTHYNVTSIKPHTHRYMHAQACNNTYPHSHSIAHIHVPLPRGLWGATEGTISSRICWSTASRMWWSGAISCRSCNARAQSPTTTRCVCVVCVWTCVRVCVCVSMRVRVQAQRDLQHQELARKITRRAYLLSNR